MGNLKKNGFICKSFYIPVNDGWECHVNHYFRAGKITLKKIPVVLCHGIAVNSQLFCISGGDSMVEFITSFNYHVYSVDLRGVGRSIRGNDQADGIDFSFDELLTDVEPIIKHLIKYHRQFNPDIRKIHWVGHSMGALLMFSFLSQNKRNHSYLKSFVSIGAPVEMKDIGHPVLLDVAKLKKYVYNKKQINIRPLKRAFASLLTWLNTRYNHIFFNKYALANETVKEFLKQASDNVPPSLLKQFGSWILKREMKSMDGSFCYENMGRNIKVPVLLLSGSYDVFSPPHLILKTYSDIKLSKWKKKVVIFSRANGDSHDYCHASVIMGQEASKEIFPVILDWIKKFS